MKHGEAVNDKWRCIDDMRLHKQQTNFQNFNIQLEYVPGLWFFNTSRPWFIVAKCHSYWKDLNAMLSAAKASCSDSLSHAVCPLTARHFFNCVLSGVRRFLSRQANSQSLCKKKKIGWVAGNLPFPLEKHILYVYVCMYIHWPDKSYASWVVLLQNPFPLESFCQHDSGQFPPRKSFLVY